MSEKITLEEIIGFFEKDIKASEKRIKKIIVSQKSSKVELSPNQLKLIQSLKEEQVLRYVISKLKQFNNQKKV